MNNLIRRTIAVALLCLAGMTAAMAQEARYAPWRFGLNLGVNYNLAGVGYARWVQDRGVAGHFIPLVGNDGSGIGPYIGLNAEYVSQSWWGITLRASYDSRNLTANDDQSWLKPTGGFYNDEFAFSNQYLSFEPRLRITPSKNSGLHISVGPSLSLALNTTYDYTPEGGATLSGIELPDASSLTYAFAGGLGYDILLNEPNDDWHWFISPFVEASWLLAQRGVDFTDIQGSFDDALSTTSFRAGVTIKLGKARGASDVAEAQDGFFLVEPPADGVTETSIVEEFFPLIPYVFFDRNDVEIPKRYNRLGANANEEFDATPWDSEDLTNVQAREFRQGEVYYNILNVFGKRLADSPAETVTLIGSDPIEKNGGDLADKVKQYLVDSWKIDAGRISTRGQTDPRIVSGTARTPQEDRPLADIENRRVEFDFKNKGMLREAHVKAKRSGSLDNNIRIELTTNENIESWTVRINGNGVNRTFGPFYGMEELIPPAGMLGNNTSGRFFAEVVARTTDGRTLSDTKSFELRRASNERKSSRFSIVFDYAEQDPIGRYENFLKNDAAERIPDGATVFIHGHTDNIGKEETNKKLSRERADQAKKALVSGLRAKGKRNVKVYAVGRGEDTTDAPFDNSTPEGRHYNRTVIIDVVPKQ
ncbi:MAG: OmpA family protein [Candidatus Kapabacteria bacterium]|nr:OmpA family protein [Candidatus Kapabacteria bacterium]